jgi:hypothetical protein
MDIFFYNVNKLRCFAFARLEDGVFNYKRIRAKA